MKKSLFGIFTSFLLLISCGEKNSTTFKENKKVLNVAQSADAKSLDPHATNDSPSAGVMIQIYDSLVNVDENLNIIPNLAESWKEISPTKYQFNLKKGVLFHNGEELKASDVVFTFNRMLSSPRVSHIVGPMKTIKEISDYIVEIELSNPFAPILYHLAHPASLILNEKAVIQNSDSYGQNPIGTGPFQLSNWIPGDKIILSKNNNYFKNPAKVDEINIKVVNEATNRVIGLETGELDMSINIAPIDINQVKSNKDLILLEDTGFGMNYLGFNTLKAPFNNKNIRKAIAYAINSEDIIEAVVLNSGTKANSPVPKGVFGYDQSIEPIEWNPNLSKEIIKNENLENKIKTKIWTNDDATRLQIAQIVQSQLKDVGIESSIESLEWGAFLEGTAREEHEIIILGWGNVTGDADYSLYPVFNTATDPSAGRRTIYSNTMVDQLLNNARETTNREIRLNAYSKVQEIIKEDVPLIPLYYPKYNVGINKKVKNFKISPMGHHSFYEIEL